MSFISLLKTLEVVKREFVTFVLAKRLLSSLALCYLLCRGLSVRVVYFWSWVDIVIMLHFLCKWIVEILHAVKAGTLSLVHEPQNKSLVFVTAFSLAYTVLILLALLFLLSLHLLLSSCIISIYRLLLSQSGRQLSTSTHCLEEYRGEVLEPFIGNLASLLNLS